MEIHGEFMEIHGNPWKSIGNQWKSMKSIEIMEIYRYQWGDH